MSKTDQTLILASQSKSRRQLLTNAGLTFSAEPAEIDERALEAAHNSQSPQSLARHLAEKKAQVVSEQHRDAIVIGADQVLDFEKNILHKPKTRLEAKSQLLAFANKTHTLSAAYALAQNGQIIDGGVDLAHMTMRDFSEHEVEIILDLMNEDYLYCVGAYSLEGAGVQLFKKIDGDYFTILGLPMLPLLAALRKTGII